MSVYLRKFSAAVLAWWCLVATAGPFCHAEPTPESGPVAESRAPEAPESDSASAEPAPSRSAHGAMSLDMVTDDAVAVLALRPQGFFGPGEFKVLDQLLNQQGSDYRIPVPVTQIEQLTMVMTRPNTERPPRDASGTSLVFDINIIRAVQPIDWDTKRKSQRYEMREAEHAGRVFFTIPDQPNICFWPADDRTCVVAEPWTIKRVIEQAPGAGARLPWADSWDQLADSALVIAFEPAWAARTIKERVQSLPDLKLPAAMLEGLLKDTKSLLCALDAPAGVRGRLLLSCADEQQATKRLNGLKGFVSLGRQLFKPKPVPKTDAGVDERAQAAAEATAKRNAITEKLLASAEFTQTGAMARVTVQGDVEVAMALQVLTSTLGGVLSPSVAAASASFEPTPTSVEIRPVLVGVVNSPSMLKRRDLSKQQISAVATAIIKYHDRQQTLPPCASASATGAPLLSWRVLILPDLGYEKLFREFHLDEPWDSEHNLPLAQKMPREYGGPLAADAQPVTTNTSLFALVGPQTCFSEGATRRLADLADGRDRTLLVIEARGDTIWTKPEDVTVDAAGRPSRRLAGLHAGGVVLATADGQARFVVEREIAELLPALLSIAGGESVGAAKLRAP
ncbi:MAG: DUF1559 domain-containing protein [Pirellulales bacterium]|nr:DUF1559 domain-containing protein [Pirellulales bacterium]